MKDRDFLIWIHERLEHVHNENRFVDYMHKLRAVILNTPENQESRNVICSNSIKEIKALFKKTDEAFKAHP